MRKRIVIPAGTRLGMLTLLEDSYSRAKALVRCDCGKIKTVRCSDILSGDTKACGCLKGKATITHNMTKTPEHRAWINMRVRCNNKSSKAYRNYGGRGISICDAWSDFTTFLGDMGHKPFPGAELDRIDNNGNYSPDNCRWVTRSENQRNKRNSHILEYNGASGTIVWWAQHLGLTPHAIYDRLYSGWGVERILTTKLRVLKRKER